MKKFPLIAAVVFLSALPAVAQLQSEKPAYRVDNFDLAIVRIESPAPVIVSRKTGRTRVLTSTTPERPSSSLAPTRLGNNAAAGTLAGFTTGNPTVDSYIVDSGRRNSVDPLLLYAIMHQESTFKPGAMSNKGARGLMQLMPGTAVRFGVTSIWDPKQNIEGGTRYMRFLLDKFNGDVQLALAGYNAGEGAVMKYGYRIPPYSETQEYVRRISKRYDLIRDPLAYRYANNYTRQQVALNQRKESAPLTIYERSVFAVRLPDGQMQLITQ